MAGGEGGRGLIPWTVDHGHLAVDVLSGPTTYFTQKATHFDQVQIAQKSSEIQP